LVVQKKIDQAISLIKKKKFRQASEILIILKTEDINLSFQFKYLLGVCYENLKEKNNAVKSYSDALNLNPNHLPCLFNLANLYIDINHIISIDLFKKCLAINKDFEEARLNLSSIYLKIKNFVEANKILGANYYINNELNINKLCALYELRLHVEFIKLARKIRKSLNQISPKLASKYYTALGVYFLYFRKINLSKKYFKKAVALNKNSRSKLNLRETENLEKIFLNLKKMDTKKTNTINSFNKSIFFSIAKNKIKIAFVSSDFRQHAVSYQLYDFLIYLLKNFKDNYDFYFFYNYISEDNITINLKKNSSNWFNIFSKSDNEVFDIIKKLKINILFDLNGLSENNRNSIYYNKQADILINWCGWLTSTYNKNFDYILGDSHVFENFNQSFYLEKPLVLKRIWSTISKSLIKNQPNFSKEKNSKTIFLCPQRFDKINNDELILAWKEIINHENTQKLYLSNLSFSDSHLQNKILKKFKNFNCDLEKIKFCYSNDRFSYLEKFKEVDIALDSHPYSGGTTAFELAYMLIPTITLKRNHFISNSTYSVNANIGLQNCISSSNQEYVSKAIELSKNNTLYNDVRNQIKNKVFNEDIFCHKKFTSDFLDLFRKL